MVGWRRISAEKLECSDDGWEDQGFIEEVDSSADDIIPRLICYYIQAGEELKLPSGK